MFLEISKKSEKHLCQNLFLKKLQAGDACTFFKKETLEEVFPVNTSGGCFRPLGDHHYWQVFVIFNVTGTQATNKVINFLTPFMQV